MIKGFLKKYKKHLVGLGVLIIFILGLKIYDFMIYDAPMFMRESLDPGMNFTIDNRTDFKLPKLSLFIEDGFYFIDNMNFKAKRKFFTSDATYDLTKGNPLYLSYQNKDKKMKTYHLMDLPVYDEYANLHSFEILEMDENGILKLRVRPFFKKPFILYPADINN